MSEVLPFARSFGPEVYIETPTARAIGAVLESSMLHPEIGIGLVVGTPGLGKTMALRTFAKANHAALCTMSPLSAKPSIGVTHVCDAMASRTRSGAAGARFYEVHSLVERFKRANLDDLALLMIDEAQCMAFEMTETLRYIYDTTGLAMVLVGNPLFKSQTRSAPFAQLNSRLGPQLVMDGPMPGDVAAICAHYRIAGARPLSQLEKLAQLGGGLRTVLKVIRQADRLAKAGKAIEPHHIDAAAELLALA